MSLQSEIEAIEKAHRAAQARLGLSGAFLSLDQWKAVSANRPGPTSGSWLARATRMIYVMRKKSSRLAKSYYNLVRALETGHALNDPSLADQEITLSLLRKQFMDFLLELATIDTEPSDTDDPDEKWFESELRNADIEGADENARSVNLSDTALDPYIQELLNETGTDDKPIRLEDYEWEEDLSLEEVDKQFSRKLRELSVVNQNAKVRKITGDAEDAEAALRKIEEQHMLSGSRGAGYIDWAGSSAGRRQIDRAFTRDRRAMLVARGLGPNPCAFCAMLASRGFSYASEASATTSRSAEGDIKKYHHNCHCYPIVRFTATSPLPEDNAYYEEMWPKVTGSHVGAAAQRRAWRRWIEAERRKRLEDTANNS